MKVIVTGKNSKNIEELIKNLGIEIVQSNPEVIVSFGGDGTLLYSERIYQGIPKLPVRDSLVCKKCSKHNEITLFTNLLKGKLKLKQYRKLETTILYKTLIALNDFVIRNITPIHTIRFQTSLTQKLLIGDGIVVSTPFGSTGYFKSITGKTFDKGFGIAFNNTTEKFSPLNLKENDKITFNLVRGQATLSYDNNPDILTLDEGSELVFKLSDKAARIYEADSLRCPNCKVTR